MKKIFWLYFIIVIIIGSILFIMLVNHLKKPTIFDYSTTIKIDMSKKINNSSDCHDINECALRGNMLIYTKVAQAADETSELEIEEGLDNINNGDIIGRYTVHNDQLQTLDTTKLSEEKHKLAQEQFNLFIKLIPSDWRENIKQYAIIKNSNIKAYVARLGSEAQGQELGIDSDNMKQLPLLIQQLVFIHEFAHIFSDNYDQYHDQRSCELQIMSQNLNCLQQNCYLNQFYLLFWKDVPHAFIENSNKNVDVMMKFYQLNQNKFVTPYAASNPYEDFAESFTEFVITPTNLLNKGTPKDDKIKFFYQYPELVLLRYQLLNNLIVK